MAFHFSLASSDNLWLLQKKKKIRKTPVEEDANFADASLTFRRLLRILLFFFFNSDFSFEADNLAKREPKNFNILTALCVEL